MMKSPWCNPIHQGLSRGIENKVRGPVIWEISTSVLFYLTNFLIFSTKNLEKEKSFSRLNSNNVLLIVLKKIAKSLTSQNCTKPGKYKPSIETGINLVLSLVYINLVLVYGWYCLRWGQTGMFFHTSLCNSTIYWGCSRYTIKPFYNHANFSHILVCVTQFFLGIICFI